MASGRTYGRRRPGAVASGPGSGCPDTTCQPSGAVTTNVKRALRSGCSKFGEHPARVGGLEVGVEVGGAVDGVDEPVQTLAAAAVAALGLDHQLVGPGRQARHGEPRAVVPGDVELAAVEPGGDDPVGDQVDPGLPVPRGEGDRAARGERGGVRVRGPAQVELDTVARDGERLRARCGTRRGSGSVEATWHIIQEAGGPPARCVNLPGDDLTSSAVVRPLTYRRRPRALVRPRRAESSTRRSGAGWRRPRR